MIAEDSVRFAHSGPSPCPCPGVDMPPQSLLSSLLEYGYKNIAILLIIKGIAIVYIRKFCYIRSAKSYINSTLLTWQR